MIDIDIDIDDRYRYTYVIPVLPPRRSCHHCVAVAARRQGRRARQGSGLHCAPSRIIVTPPFFLVRFDGADPVSILPYDNEMMMMLTIMITKLLENGDGLRHGVGGWPQRGGAATRHGSRNKYTTLLSLLSLLRLSSPFRPLSSQLFLSS